MGYRKNKEITEISVPKYWSLRHLTFSNQRNTEKNEKYTKTVWNARHRKYKGNTKNAQLVNTGPQGITLFNNKKKQTKTMTNTPTLIMRHRKIEEI